MMALGEGVHENKVFDLPIDSTDLVPTIGGMLDFSTDFAQGKRIPGLA
jgi:hypothetical protein